MGATLRISGESIQGANVVWMPRVEIFDQLLAVIASALTDQPLIDHITAPINERPYLTLADLNDTAFRQITEGVSQAFETLLTNLLNGSSTVTPAFLRDLSELKSLLLADYRYPYNETHPGTIQVNDYVAWSAVGYMYDFILEQIGLLAHEGNEERMARLLVNARLTAGLEAMDLSPFGEERFCFFMQQVRTLQQRYGDGRSVSAHAPGYYPEFGRKIVALYYALLDDPRRKACQFITVIK